MSDINNLRFQLGAEIEALITEVEQLKARVTKLETDVFRASHNNRHYVGKWVGKLKKPGKKDFIG